MLFEVPRLARLHLSAMYTKLHWQEIIEPARLSR